MKIEKKNKRKNKDRPEFIEVIEKQLKEIEYLLGNIKGEIDNNAEAYVIRGQK